MSEAEEAMMLADWCDVLADLPQTAIEMAVTGWVARETRRPMPADIRRAAVALIDWPRPKPAAHELPFGPVQVISKEEVEHRRQVVAQATRRLASVRAMRNIPADGDGR